MALIAQTQLANGISIPTRGFGTAGLNGWRNDGREVVDTLLNALKHGYRHFDTSPVYGNERSVGAAIRQSRINRNSIFITSKVPMMSFGYDNALRAFESSLDRLNLEYIDLYLLHWPVSGKNRQTWKALEKLVEENRVRSIGVSNFDVADLKSLQGFTHIPAVCNQIELHPYCCQNEIRQFCDQNDIRIISGSPLGVAQWKSGDSVETPFRDPLIQELAIRHTVTPAQILLRWHYQHNLIAIPKAQTSAHIRQNFSIGEFVLGAEEMSRIDELDRHVRFGAVPETILYQP